MEVREFLGLDVGKARTGIARGSNMAKIAQPLQTVPTDKLDDYLTKLVKENSVSGVVVGLPRNLGGNDTDQTTWVRQWVKEIQPQLNIPFYWQDEALTTELSPKNSKAGVDAEAAAMVLQDFLNTPEEDRLPC